MIVDRTRRAKLRIVFGNALAGFVRPLVALITCWPALLATSMPASQRGLAFGLHHAMDNGGAIVGSLVASALLAGGMGLRDVFMWSLVPAILCLLLALALREPAHDAAVPQQSFDSRLNDMPPLLALSFRLWRRRLLVGGYLAYGIFYLAISWLNVGLMQFAVLPARGEKQD